MGDISEPVKKCIAIIKAAGSDTEKFAGLFMVTKLIKGKDCTSNAKKAIFEAIGFKFLKKLLLSDDVPDDCPPALYKSVALSILTCFCRDPEVATHPDMIANIPVFLDIVMTSDDDDDNLIIVNESYTCLQSIAFHEVGRKALIDVGAISKMSEIYSHQSFQTDEALNLIVALIGTNGSKAWGTDPKNFHSLVNKIALDFETDNSERKYELAGILNSLLFNCNRMDIAESASEEIWPLSIYKALNDILTSRIGKNQRDPALKLASTVVSLMGIEWSINDEENPRKFFLLLIQLCAIEVRMQLDDKSFKQALINAELVTSCFNVLELAINYMANDLIDLEQKEKQTVYTGLKGAFSAVVSVLTKISNDKNRDKLPDVEKLYICAMVRVLVAWLAQETTAMRAQVYALLPYMLSLANDTFYACRARKMAEKKQSETPMETNDSVLGQVDILRVMLPSICHLVVEDKARDIILKTKQDEVLYECMAFHWSIVHYEKPKIPKSERGKAKTLPDPEMDPDLLEQMKDSRVAMVSLCNIFMNLTVLEGKFVEESILFNTLMKFIFNNLPELKNSPENLVLHGHMSILGLLLLKQQSLKVKKNDFSICRYIQSTIRFLWDAYNVDESNDPTAMVVSMVYKEYWSEIMELWFLGMQTMSAVLALVPWISEFALESGWAEGILEMLKKVKIGTLPANVKSAFEDFLCHLVDANPEVVQVLKKADALRVCRNHRLMELGKKLFEFGMTMTGMLLNSWYLCQLNGILKEQYGVPNEDADRATSTFLRSFRRCPDNPQWDLDSWRLHLWTEALDEEYSHLANDIYLQWLDLRYHYLAISPDIISLLLSLRKHYLLGLITNGPSRAQWEKVERLELRHYFDCILVSGDLPWEKPDQKIFQEACQYLRVEPRRCIMVGDKLETDIQGGIEAELGGTVWVPLTSTESAGDVTPDYTIDSVIQLPDVLTKNLMFCEGNDKPKVKCLSEMSTLTLSDDVNDNKIS